MSLETEKLLLEGKINVLKKDRELKKMEGEALVTQIREELSPYYEFADMDVSKAKVLMDRIVALKSEMDIISTDIKNLEKKLR